MHLSRERVSVLARIKFTPLHPHELAARDASAHNFEAASLPIDGGTRLAPGVGISDVDHPITTRGSVELGSRRKPGRYCRKKLSFDRTHALRILVSLAVDSPNMDREV